MIKVAIVGSGKVSQQLFQVFSKTDDVEVTEVLPSRGEAFDKALILSNETYEGPDRKQQPDIYIIAVSDDAITAVSQKLTGNDKIVVHTSGSVPLTAISSSNRRGVFYPLQTFSKERKVDFKHIPICLEAERPEDLAVLRRLAQSISDSVYDISSKQRKSLHLAAVFVNNFTNQLFQIGNEICSENDVPFDILKPLIKETAAKIESHSPANVQTGPAKRKDEKTIAYQIEQLKDPVHKEIYKIMTKSINETHGKKL